MHHFLSLLNPRIFSLNFSKIGSMKWLDKILKLMTTISNEIGFPTTFTNLAERK